VEKGHFSQINCLNHAVKIIKSAKRSKLQKGLLDAREKHLKVTSTFTLKFLDKLEKPLSASEALEYFVKTHKSYLELDPQKFVFRNEVKVNLGLIQTPPAEIQEAVRTNPGLVTEYYDSLALEAGVTKLSLDISGGYLASPDAIQNETNSCSTD
jgi:hypothetical protein